jgi:hypothetical protein
MGWVRNSAVSLIIVGTFATQATAEAVPPLLANFPVTQNEDVKQAFAEQVRASFPRDIRSSTLSALLEMDGFSVKPTDAGYAASFMQTKFPCITDYVLTWREGSAGRVSDLDIQMRRKCV